MGEAGVGEQKADGGGEKIDRALALASFVFFCLRGYLLFITCITSTTSLCHGIQGSHNRPLYSKFGLRGFMQHENLVMWCMCVCVAPKSLVAFARLRYR